MFHFRFRFCGSVSSYGTSSNDRKQFLFFQAQAYQSKYFTFPLGATHVFTSVQFRQLGVTSCSACGSVLCLNRRWQLTSAFRGGCPTRLRNKKCDRIASSCCSRRCVRACFRTPRHRNNLCFPSTEIICMAPRSSKDRG